MAEERTHTDSGTGTPIAENEQVKALLALLKENDSPAYADFAKLIESVTGMENRLSIAVGELEAMREDLQKMQDRSLKASLQKTCKTLEGNIASMQQKLSELKGKIVEGCRHILVKTVLPVKQTMKHKEKRRLPVFYPLRKPVLS